MKQPSIDKKKRIVKMPSGFNEDVFLTKHKDFKVDYDKYYKKQNFIVRGWRYFVHYIFAKPLFYLYGKIVLGIKIKGKKNLKGIKTGAVVVSNHVHYMDWSFTSTFIAKQHRTAVVSLKDNFKIPCVRKLCEVYGCLPIPDTPSANMKFHRCIQENLKAKRFIHIFSEASLWPYYNKLRPFMRGAFYFAAKYGYPILPYVIVFRKSKGLGRIFRRQPRMTLVVGEPQYASPDAGDIKAQIAELQERVESLMQKMIEENDSYEFYKYVSAEEFDRLETKK